MRLKEKTWNVCMDSYAELKNKNKNKYYQSKGKENTKTIFKAFNIIKSLLNGDNIKLLSQGNHKLNKNIYTWGIAEGMTCCGGCVCKGVDNKECCYCLKSTRLYSNTRVSRQYKTILAEYFSKNHSNIFIKNIKNQINKSKLKNKFLRIHDSGDFFSTEYLQLILKLSNSLKNIAFVYTYSKILPHAIIDYINKVFKNIKINKSIINIIRHNKTYKHYNFFNINNNMELLQLKLFLKQNKDKNITICGYGQKDKSLLYLLKSMYNVNIAEKHCGMCTSCMNKNIDYVLFIQH